MKRVVFATGVLLSAGLYGANIPVVNAGTNYGYANEVVAGDSTSGGYSVTGWTGQLQANAGTAFSKPTNGDSGSGHYYLTPFEPAWVTPRAAAASSTYSPVGLASVNAGDTLALAFNGITVPTSLAINGGFTLGIHAGVGLEDTTANSSNSYSGSGVVANPAATFNSRISYLAVGDGTNWVWYAGETFNSTGTTVISTQWTASSTAIPTLTNATSSGAALMTFNDPSAYYGVASGDSGSPYYVAPDGGNNTVTPASGTPLSDPAQAFTGTLGAFNGENYRQVMTTLNGSAGGDWFNVSTTGLPDVTEVALVAPSGSNSMYVQAVIGVVPEPATLMMLLAGVAVLPLLRRRGHVSAKAS
ncbi:MAG: hypothetical protein ACP5VQ_06650 [Phycisphaerae bacterium]